jgi:hypothetical protein
MARVIQFKPGAAETIGLIKSTNLVVRVATMWRQRNSQQGGLHHV